MTSKCKVQVEWAKIESSVWVVSVMWKWNEGSKKIRKDNWNMIKE